MKKCDKCSNEIGEGAKFCDECGEKIINTNEDNIEIEDIIAHLQNTKKDIDFNKLDEESTSEEIAKKTVWLAMDKLVAETLGGDTKKKIDEIYEKSDYLLMVKENLNRLAQIGKEIEKNMLLQKTYLGVFFENEPENNFKVVVNKMTDEILKNDSLTNDERLSMANKILQIIDSYRDKVMTELVAKQEIINALIPTFENKIKEINFEKYEEEVDQNLFEIHTNALKWLKLTKELLPYRDKAVEAVKENLEMEEILPSAIVEYEGDISVKLKNNDMFTKSERVLKLTSEADEAENRISPDRVEVSQLLFGKEEDYMDFLKTDETEEESETNQTASRNKTIKWAIVIILSIIALSGGIWTAIGVFVLGIIIINVIKK